MNNEDPGNDDKTDGGEKQPARLLRFIGCVHEQLAKLRAQKEKETPQDKFSRRTANATVAIAVLTLVLGVIGVKQWITLKRTDETTRQALINVQRAFVIADDLEIVPVIGAEGKPDYWKVSPMLENGGNTGTRDMHFFPGFMRDKRTVMPELKRLDPDQTEVEFSTRPTFPAALGPKAKIPQATYIISRDDVADMKTGKLAIYILGAALYRDVFDDTPMHITKFCFRLFGTIGNTGISSTYGLNAVKLREVDGLSARMCAHNNCTDSECPRQGYSYQPAK